MAVVMAVFECSPLFFLCVCASHILQFCIFAFANFKTGDTPHLIILVNSID